MPPRLLRLILAGLLLAGLDAAGPIAASRPDPMASEGPTPPAILASVRRIQQGLDNIRLLRRPGQDGYATVWDGDKYVQCGLARGGGLRCETAGALMQPSLARVLTADGAKRLALLGWKLDPHFGNYVRVLPPDLSSEQDAVNLMIALGGVYGADLATLQVQTDWVAHQACPPRNGPSQNLAGLINDAPSMAATAIHACAYFDPAAARAADLSAAALIQRDGPQVTAELQRLRVNVDRRVYVILQAEVGYVQCETQTDPRAIYCEALSADSWPGAAVVLTPDRIARLHAAGYADPGRAPNYWKVYPLDSAKDADIAAELLTLLHDVYGYTGAAPLKVGTEKGDAPD